MLELLRNPNYVISFPSAYSESKFLRSREEGCSCNFKANEACR